MLFKFACLTMLSKSACKISMRHMIPKFAFPLFFANSSGCFHDLLARSAFQVCFTNLISHRVAIVCFLNMPFLIVFSSLLSLCASLKCFTCFMFFACFPFVVFSFLGLPSYFVFPTFVLDLLSYLELSVRSYFPFLTRLSEFKL